MKIPVSLPVKQEYQRKKRTSEIPTIHPAAVVEQNLSYFTQKWTANTHITIFYISTEGWFWTTGKR